MKCPRPRLEHLVSALLVDASFSGEMRGRMRIGPSFFAAGCAEPSCIGSVALTGWSGHPEDGSGFS